MSVQLEIDKASFDRLNKQMDAMKATGKYSGFDALAKAAMAIKTEAQLRLTGRKHVVTSRLKNSIYIKVGRQTSIPLGDNSTSYEYDNIESENGKKVVRGKKTGNRELKTVQVDPDQIAVGTNVEYAGKIENMDSFLYWAYQNVNVQQLTQQKMKADFERFTK